MYEQYSLYGHSVRRFDGERLDDQREWAISLSRSGRTGYVGYRDWWKKTLGISDYGIAWISFIKGILIGLLIYHFFID